VVARLDAELVRRGLARSRRDASELVAAGRVTVDGVAATRSARPTSEADRILVDRPAHAPEYASRAAFKLAGVLDALDAVGKPVATAGARCLDLGASTGGFTDVLLRRGARAVLAVDVGHDQLVDRLRDDARVTARDGVNVRDLDEASVPLPPDVVVGDLSFISLNLVLPAVARVVSEATDVLLMVKPQFEVGRERLGSGGVVRDDRLRQDAVITVIRAAAEVGLAATDVVPSPLPGPNGNREYFVRLREGSLGASDDAVARAVRAAIAAPLAEPADAWSSPPEPPVLAIEHDRPIGIDTTKESVIRT
jgi:23S rRNA (cytidine1920-2'-O)/16S rRNA (cytidine1409-2'-O)-methyltransferase